MTVIMWTKDDPKWLVLLCYLATTLLAAAIALLRNTPWTKGSAAALVVAWGFGFMVFLVASRISRGRPVAPPLHRPPVGEPVARSWLDRPYGVLAQYALLTAAAAALAVIWR